MKKKWYSIKHYPLRAVSTVIEFTTRGGDFCSTGYTEDMQELVEGLEDTEVSRFSSDNFRELHK
jgi:hypothetical protein